MCEQVLGVTVKREPFKFLKNMEKGILIQFDFNALSSSKNEM